MLGNKRPKPREAKHLTLRIVGLYQTTDGVDHPVAPSGVRTFSSGK